MNRSRLSILAAIIAGTLISSAAFAGQETRCYAYNDANKLAYCLQALQQRGAIRTAGMEPGTARLYQTLVTQQINPPTIVPAGGMYYAPYGIVPAAGITYAQQPNALSAVANVAGSMLAASAWAYNWRHGYIGANGIYGASYLMNYDW